MLVHDFTSWVVRIVVKVILRNCCIGMSEMMLGHDFRDPMFKIVVKGICSLGTVVNDII